MIDVIDLNKVFDNGFEALKSVNFSIEQGDLVCLLGPSGCGKSTILNLIAGLLTPTGGDIQFKGSSVVTTEPKDRNIGFVFQNYALYPHMTVLENIMFPLTVGKNKISKEEATVLAAGYEAKKADAERMLNIVKTFPFEYMRNTGRTFKLGGREKSNITLSFKDVQASTRSFPKQEGIDKDGKAIYVKTEVKVPGYESIKVQNPCPAWVKK